MEMALGVPAAAASSAARLSTALVYVPVYQKAVRPLVAGVTTERVVPDASVAGAPNCAASSASVPAPTASGVWATVARLASVWVAPEALSVSVPVPASGPVWVAVKPGPFRVSALVPASVAADAPASPPCNAAFEKVSEAPATTVIGSGPAPAGLRCALRVWLPSSRARLPSVSGAVASPATV